MGTSPELVAWMAAAAGAWFCIKLAKLSELQPQYKAGNLSTPPGDSVGLRLLGRWATQLEVLLLGQLYRCAMKKLVRAHKVDNTLITGIINCESRALVMLRLILSKRCCCHPKGYERRYIGATHVHVFTPLLLGGIALERQHSFEAKP